MPNQSNFRSDVTNKADPRYTASRIVKFPSEGILLEEIPASFGFDLDDNIEVHFYTIATNVLMFSSVVPLDSNILKLHVVSYSDGTYKNYIRIDFTKLFVDDNIVLVPGNYKMVLNFFSNEIGSYDNKILTVDVISPSRTEVQLAFNNSTDAVVVEDNKKLAKEFVVKSFERPDAVGVAEKIFLSGVQLSDPTEGLNSTNIISNITVTDIGQTFDNTISRIERLGLRESFDTQIDAYLSQLYEYLREEIVINGDERIQQDEFDSFIEKVVIEQMVNMRQIVDSRIKIS